jgi:hypothetical protein
MKIGDKVRLKQRTHPVVLATLAFLGIILTETYIVDDVFMSGNGIQEVIVITGNREKAINVTCYSSFFELTKSVGFVIE